MFVISVSVKLRNKLFIRAKIRIIKSHILSHILIFLSD